MKTLEFYIVQENKVVPPEFVHNESKDTYFTLEDISKQAKLLNIDYTLTCGALSGIPRKTDSFLFIVLSENSLIPGDFLSKILSINNLHRDAACFCGPRIARSSKSTLDLANFLKLYQNYSLDSFSTFISCYINGQDWLYPSISGSIFSGRHYNSVGGYSEHMSPRGPVENIEFFNRIDRSGPMVYSECLKTYKFLTDIDMVRPYMTQWCYEQGYVDQSMNRNSYLKTVVDTPTTQDLLSFYELGRHEQISKQKLWSD